MKVLNFLPQKKHNICINVFCYGNNLVYCVHTSDEKFKDCMDLLLTTDINKSHYAYIKDFNKFICAIRQGVRIKSNFVDIVYNVSVVKEFW